jgi:undecaprenyl-diphosphatase
VGRFDQALFHWINQWPDSLSPFFVGLSEGNKWPIVRAALFFLFVLLVAWRPARRSALTAAVAWPLANAVAEALKWGLQTPRPSAPVALLVDHGTPLAEALARHPEVVLRVAPLGSFGTASAHAANMMAVAVCFLSGHRPLGWAWLVLAILTGLSRIYVGVHYPSQVVLGWVCGAFAAMVVIKTAEAWSQLRSNDGG